MEKVNQYRVIKDYYDPEDNETWDVKEWHDHEVFDKFQDAWAKMKRLIFKVNNLEKKYGSISALDLKKLDIHPGTIYGIVGNVGSGKSTLLNKLRFYLSNKDENIFTA